MSIDVTPLVLTSSKEIPIEDISIGTSIKSSLPSSAKKIDLIAVAVDVILRKEFSTENAWISATPVQKSFMSNPSEDKAPIKQNYLRNHARALGAVLTDTQSLFQNYIGGIQGMIRAKSPINDYPIFDGELDSVLQDISVELSSQTPKQRRSHFPAI